jgi:hypothetical protein
MKTRPAADMLGELEQELSRVRVLEAPIAREGRYHIEGLQEAATIWVNPRIAIVEIFIHELLHVRYPRWTEQRVNREGRRLLMALDDAGIAKWHRRYQKAKRISARRVGRED